jgi:hypothetical protein
VLFWSGMLVGLAAAALTWSLPARAWRTGAALSLVAACAAAQLVIAPRIDRVRASVGGAMDALDPSDPRRQAFGRLHGLSVLCLGVAGLAALVAVMLLARLISTRTAP